MGKINFKLLSGLCLVFILLLTFCSRQNDEMNLPQATIQITAPVEHSVVRFGETLSIKGTATSNAEMHGYEIGIRKSGGSNQFFQNYHGHGNTIVIEESLKNTINETVDMELVINVILDHELHKQSKIVQFKIQN